MTVIPRVGRFVGEREEQATVDHWVPNHRGRVARECALVLNSKLYITAKVQLFQKAKEVILKHLFIKNK